jgi:hypothetical protein
MFAGILEVVPKFEKRDEFIKVMKNDVLPILKKQTRILEILPFVPQEKTEKMVIVSLWAEKRYAEKYMREGFPNGGADRETVPYDPNHLENICGGDYALRALRKGSGGLKSCLPREPPWPGLRIIPAGGSHRTMLGFPL